MLPSSLNKLAKSFYVEDKTIFPYNFVSKENIENNYSGQVPALKYFDNLTLEEYNLYNSQFNNSKPWNLRVETIKYNLFLKN